MIERLKNYQYAKVYNKMINEAKMDPIAMIDTWQKENLSNVKDQKKVKKSLENIKKMIKDDTDNIELMDKITSEFLVISKQITDEETLEKLSNILQKI